MALEIRKKSLLVWKFIDTVNIKEFIPSRFSVNTLDNTVTVIYKDGANSRTYDLSQIELYDLGSISPFPTFVTIEAFMLKLEQMNCPCFPEISVIGGVQSIVAGANISVDNTDPLNPIVSASVDGGSSTWGGITGTLSAQTDLQTALNNKLDKVTTNDGIEKVYIKNADGTQVTKATSDFKDVLEFVDFASFPTTGESEKIYIDLFYNLQYRWSGSAYVQIGGGSETLLQVKGFATDFPVSNLIGTSAPMSNLGIASGTADYNRNLISTTETGHQGMVALRSSTNANSGFCFFYGGGIINNGDKHVSFFQFKLPTVANIKGYVGFHQSTSTAEPTNACFLEIVNNTGVFKTRGVSLTTASSSFTLSTNTWYNLMVEFKSTTEVYFKIKLDDGTLVAEFTSTTNLPLFNSFPFTVAVNVFSTVATTARDLMLLDYVEYRPEKPNHLKSF